MKKISIKTFKNKLMCLIIDLEEKDNSKVSRVRTEEDWKKLYEKALQQMEEK